VRTRARQARGARARAKLPGEAGAARAARARVNALRFEKPIRIAVCAGSDAPATAATMENVVMTPSRPPKTTDLTLDEPAPPCTSLCSRRADAGAATATAAASTSATEAATDSEEVVDADILLVVALHEMQVAQIRVLRSERSASEAQCSVRQLQVAVCENSTGIRCLESRGACHYWQSEGENV
jgi:hypothetical protein